MARRNPDPQSSAQVVDVSLPLSQPANEVHHAISVTKLAEHVTVQPTSDALATPVPAPTMPATASSDRTSVVAEGGIPSNGEIAIRSIAIGFDPLAHLVNSIDNAPQSDLATYQ